MQIPSVPLSEGDKRGFSEERKEVYGKMACVYNEILQAAMK